MTENQWHRLKIPTPLWWYAQKDQSPRKLRLVGVACCRRVAHLITNERLRDAIDVCERFAEGRATKKELSTAGGRVQRAINAISPLETAEVATDPNWQALSAVHAAASGTPAFVLSAAFRGSQAFWAVRRGLLKVEREVHANIIRDVFGNPFRPVTFSPSWRTDTAVSLAKQMYKVSDFSAMPILADALEDAGCDSAEVLDHCRDTKRMHVRGCWVVDEVLGKK